MSPRKLMFAEPSRLCLQATTTCQHHRMPPFRTALRCNAHSLSHEVTIMRGRLDANCKLLADVLEEEFEALGPSAPKPKPESTEQQRLEAIFTHIHALKPGRSALCLSGGGIRSAAFGLGILQGLARQK